MNYPVWQLDFFGGGLLIAAIAVFHVYLSHFAVGGGLFLVLTQIKGYRDDNPLILDYVHKHTKFFLLITMVAGGITGVGIWFTIALLNPSATSMLIHTFVFGWAIEWVFFVIEIVALFIYYYTFGRMERKKHLTIGWIYFGAAWMSLFIINGIIDFMLTPGQWLNNGNFWSGFFNPTFWPALFFRTFFAIIIAGLFGMVTASWIKEDKLRTTLLRYSALWLILPFLLFLGSAYWYREALPADVQVMIFEKMPEMQPFINGFFLFSPILVLAGLVMAIKVPAALGRTLTAAMLVIGLLYMGCFEFIREGGRRPYIIHEYMYSTSVLKNEVQTYQQQGLLQQAKWVSHKEITADNRLDVGREAYNLLCLSCHAVGGPLNDIKKLTITYTPAGLDAMISGMDIFHPYMPPFAGNAEERYALAYYIAHGLNGKSDQETPVAITPKSVEIPSFVPESGEYVLLAWSRLGINARADATDLWTLSPTASDIQAQLILRGETPEIITDGVSLHYSVEEAFSTTDLAGTMEVGDGYFVAENILVSPYFQSGSYSPYPLFTIEARDDNGTTLAKTKVVVPVSTEMGCKNCHGGEWRVDGRAGLSTETALNILKDHDRLSGTDLVSRAETGKVTSCQSCHDSQDDSGNLNLSASLHGFHALFLQQRGAEACDLCHPSSAKGATQCMRGIHNQIGLDCINCHGSMEDNAITLLKFEENQGKQRATQLMAHLTSQSGEDKEKISAREPWVNEPDCLTCHQDFEAPETDVAFNSWSEDSKGLYHNKTDETGQIFCASCHGSAHAEYPATNPYGDNLDTIQPMQYQKEPFPIGSNTNCAVCHTVAMEEEMHHPNMLREFRN